MALARRLRVRSGAFAERDLSDEEIAYLFVDAIAERIRPGQAREAVLAAWGIGWDGRKVLLHLMAGSKEDAETARAFFDDIRRRGLFALRHMKALQEALNSEYGATLQTSSSTRADAPRQKITSTQRP